MNEPRKQLARETLNELRPRKAALDEKVEGWLAAAGGFFAASSVLTAFAKQPVIAALVGLVLIVAGWVRIVYFRTKILWIEEAAVKLNRILNDRCDLVSVDEWNGIFEEKDGCAREKNLWAGVTECPYTFMIMAALLLAQMAMLVLAW